MILGRIKYLLWTEFILKVKMNVTQSCLTLWDPMDCSLPGSSVHGILQAGILQWVAIPFSRGSSQPRDRTQVSWIAFRFFTVWASGKPKKTGMGSLSLLQWVFQTQGLNWGLLQSRSLLLCKWILYQLSSQGIHFILVHFSQKGKMVATSQWW